MNCNDYKFSKSTDTCDLKFYASINNLKKFNNFIYSSDSEYESDAELEMIKQQAIYEMKVQLKYYKKSHNELNNIINDLRCTNRYIKLLNLGLMSGIIIFGLCVLDKKKYFTITDYK